jgi:hypothetical protein
MRTVRTPATALALLLAMAASSSAQAPEGETLEQKLEAKLKEPFVSNANWVLDYAEAMKRAKEENKVIFAYFTRSYSP